MSNVQLVKSQSLHSIQPNLFTNSSVNLSRLEQKIMAKIFNRISVDQENPSMFSLTVSEISRNTNSVRKALDKLRIREFELRLDPDKEGHTIPLIGEKFYQKGTGVLAIELNAKFMEIMRLVKSSDGYTKYVLSHSLSFRSKYTQCLFELLSKWSDKTSLTIDVNQLQFLMGCKGMVYSQFNQRCLKPAIDELNEKSGFQIYCDQIRQGRNIVNIILNYRTKEKAIKQQAYQDTAEIQQEVSTMSAGHIAQAAADLLRYYTFAKWQNEKIMSSQSLFSQFAVINNLINTGAVQMPRDRTRYMAKSLFHPKKSA